MGLPLQLFTEIGMGERDQRLGALGDGFAL